MLIKQQVVAVPQHADQGQSNLHSPKAFKMQRRRATLLPIRAAISRRCRCKHGPAKLGTRGCHPGLRDSSKSRQDIKFGNCLHQRCQRPVAAEKLPGSCHQGGCNCQGPGSGRMGSCRRELLEGKQTDKDGAGVATVAGEFMVGGLEGGAVGSWYLP